MQDTRIYVWLIGGIGFALINALIATAMIDFHDGKEPATVEILVSSTQLEAGSPLFPFQMERISVPVHYLPSDAIPYDQAHRYVGHISRETIRPGTILLERDLQNPFPRDFQGMPASHWSPVDQPLPFFETPAESLRSTTRPSQGPRNQVRVSTSHRIIPCLTR